MNDKKPESAETTVRNVEQSELPKAVSSLLKHVITDHKPSDMQFAVLAFGHTASGSDGNTTNIAVCQMAGGDPQYLMRALRELMQQVLTSNPELLMPFMLEFLEFAKELHPMSVKVMTANMNDRRFDGMSPEEVADEVLRNVTSPTKH